MAQSQYFTLEQAAQILQISVDRLKEMVKKNEVRGFQDRGTLRFRSQDIEEKARQLGLGSDPELQMGEGSTPAGPDSSARRRAKAAKTGNTGAPQSKLSKKPSRLDPPKASSDSDIRLVSETGEQDFHIDPDQVPAEPRSGIKPGSDSGAVILPLEGDSDVKLETDTPSSGDAIGRPAGKSPSDSDIRLEQVSGGKKGKDLVTEEIDLDAEEAAAARKSPPPSRPRPGSSGKQPALPTTSPFELSESDLELQPMQDKAPGEQGVDSSSDFELNTGDDEVSLGDMPAAGPARSGINLQEPGDSGISLEQGGSDELDIGLAPVSDKEAAGGDPGADSSSEFELSLDDEESDSSSEFELTLDDDSGDVNASPTADSDSEFELTLDEEGDLATPGAGDALSDDEEGKDIFEPTDFDVPALDDESASEAVALTEGGEPGSSEFDLDLDEEGIGESDDAEEGGVAFDEDEDAPERGVVDVDEDADDAAETIARPVKSKGRTAVAEGEEDDDPYAGIDDEDEEGAEEEPETRPVGAAAAPLPPAEWGLFPALALLPTVVILFVVGLMTFELSRSMLGYRGTPGVSGSLVLQPLAKKLDSTLPDNSSTATK
jgi:hypothetical protein